MLQDHLPDFLLLALAFVSLSACDASARGRAGPSHGGSSVSDTSVIDGSEVSDGGAAAALEMDAIGSPDDASSTPEDVGAASEEAESGPAMDADALALPDVGHPDAGVEQRDGSSGGAGDATAGDLGALCTSAPHMAESPSVDLLLVVDNSCSMSSAQTRVAAASSLVLSSLAARGFLDFRIGVTTMDVGPSGTGGHLAGALIDRSTPNPAAALAQAIEVGNLGASEVLGLEAARRLVQTSSRTGFPRVGAGLVLVFISDGEDASPDPPSTYSAYFLQAYDALNVSANTIVGDVPGGCVDPIYGFHVVAGARFDALRQATQGVESSICSQSPVQALSNLGPPQLGMPRLWTLEEPWPAQLVDVEVGGSSLPSDGYVFDPTTGQIRFSPAYVPLPGDVVQAVHPCP